MSWPSKKKGNYKDNYKQELPEPERGRLSFC